MRDLQMHPIDRYRLCSREVIARFGSFGDSTCGFFLVPSPIDAADMKVLASSGEGWDHVSVSRQNRCPNWMEMDHVKRLFFAEDETAMQLHVPSSDHISVHPYCLHLWRPHNVEIPRPPAFMVGPKAPIKENA